MIRVILFVTIICEFAFAAPAPAPVSPKAVRETVEKAWGAVPLSSLKLGEFVRLNKTLAFEGHLDLVVDDSKEVVEARPVGPGQIQYTLFQTTLEQDAHGRWVRSESYRGIVADDAQPVFMRMGGSLPLGIETVSWLADACRSTPGYQVSCFNLVASSGVMTPPKAIVDQPDCGGFFHCQMAFNRVSFDLEARYVESGHWRTTKATYEITIALEAPLLSRLMNSCVTVPEQTTKKPARICDTVVNFER